MFDRDKGRCLRGKKVFACSDKQINVMFLVNGGVVDQKQHRLIAFGSTPAIVFCLHFRD
jgi:hypothetical protein